MGNLRQQFDFAQPYWTINREERNYAALLYYTLMSGDNISRFLEFIDCEFPWRSEELSAYVEYAYIRDLWEASHASNKAKRDVITDLLDTDDVRALQRATVLEWNGHFGVSTPVASSTTVQSPSRWSMQKFHLNIESNNDFVATCKFKWSFNIKPDLVIHTDNDHAVVIEAKYTAAEGKYPASPPRRSSSRPADSKEWAKPSCRSTCFGTCSVSRRCTSSWSTIRRLSRQRTRRCCGVTSSPPSIRIKFPPSSGTGYAPSLPPRN